MSDAISTFFSAWELDSADARLDTITRSVSSTIQYSDPRSPVTVDGIEALADYVGQFSANAPGWSAKVIKSDTTADMTRATVAFSGSGPNGEEMVQHGQYFVECDDSNLIVRMVGFAGAGLPE